MISKIRLQNWKSHGETELSFTNGANVIIGPMGAGKSSVLQAISFALFGTFSELKRKELRISDVIKRNSEIKNAGVDIELSIGNDILQIKRVIEEGNTKEATIRDKEGKLIAGTNPAQVNAYLKDVMKIDEDIFLRTIYAKQNEIDLFLQLTPIERKTRLDELMCIDKFEIARKNCVKLLNQIETKKSSQEEFIRDVNIETLEKEIEELKKACTDLLTEKESLKSKVSEAEKVKSELDIKIKAVRKNLDEINRLEEKKRILETQSKELNEKLGSVTLDEDLQSVNFRLREIKTKISELQKSKVHLKEDAERHQRNALELEKRLGMLEHKSAELANALSETEKLHADLEALEKEGKLVLLESRLKAIEDNLRTTIDQRAKILGEISVLKEHLRELEKTEGVCPICSAELTQIKKAELILQRNQKIAELQAKTQELQSSEENLRAEIRRTEEIYDKQQDVIKRIGQLGDLLREDREIAIQLSEAKGKKDTFAEIITQMQQRLDDIDTEVANLDSELTQLTEKRHLCELKEKENEIHRELERISKDLETRAVVPGEIDDLETKFRESIRNAQELDSKVKSIDYIIEEKQKRLVDFEEKKNKFIEIKDKIQSFESKIEFLSQFKNALLTAQENLRKELITAVNEVMANLWTQLYPYDKWSSIKLDASESDYLLQIREKEGEWISVSGFASGGERMLACLVLRLAFAKVLAQNINILILDEPTHNLDDRAINTLVDVIQNRLSGFLDQIFIVTHDEKLAEAGDNIIRIK
ncbi:MAG: AAA family ATPase [Candidatus Nanoarchaeia archaeon]